MKVCVSKGMCVGGRKRKYESVCACYRRVVHVNGCVIDLFCESVLVFVSGWMCEVRGAREISSYRPLNVARVCEIRTQAFEHLVTQTENYHLFFEQKTTTTTRIFQAILHLVSAFDPKF